MKKLFVLIILFGFELSSAQVKNETSMEYQLRLNKEFADSVSSPLMKEDLNHFKALDFFTISESYIVQATFSRIEGEVFEMKTSTDRKPKYRVYGLLKFQMGNKNLQLFVYQNLDLMKKPGYEDYLFLPFSDLTNGKESYIGGRYLDMRIPKSEKVIVDFNKAYNPYCAYNYKYSCPIVPMENDLAIEIKAGVKKFHD